MAYVPVPKDLTKVKTKVMFNLTKRQLICFTGGALIGVPLFFLLRKPTGNSVAAMCMMLVMLPRRIRAGAEPLPELDQFLRRHRHTDGQTHAPMGADQTELDERYARAGHTDRQTRTAPPSRLLLRGQIVRRITTANHAPRISLDWEVRGA